MKKFLAVALSATTLLATLASCGTKPATTTGKELPTFSYMYNNESVHPQVAQIIQADWAELGVDITLESQEWAVFQTTRSEHNFTVARDGWIGDYNDPMTFLDLFTSTSGQNNSQFSDPKFDQLITEAKTSSDLVERMKKMHEAEQILIESYFVVPVYYYTHPYLQNDTVSGAIDNPMLLHANLKWATKTGGTPINYAIGSAPKSIDPTLVNATDGANIVEHCFDGLTRKDKNFNIVPGLAESWTTSEDGLTWTFKLRDAKWSDGKPIVAKDYVYAWQRGVNPVTAAEYAYQYYVIENGEAINSGTETDVTKLGIKAVDDKTLEIKLVAPIPYFTELMSFPSFYPLRQDVIEATTDWSSNPATYITSGAYKMTNYTQSDSLLLEKNPAYWDAANVLCPTIKIMFTADPSTMYNGIISGEIDIADQFPPELTDEAREKGILKEAPGFGTYYLSLNAKDPALADKNVRKALALSIDREYISTTLKQGSPAYAFVPPTVNDYAAPGTTDVPTFREVGGETLFGSGDHAADVAEAKKILKAAGYAVKE